MFGKEKIMQFSFQKCSIHFDKIHLIYLKVDLSNLKSFQLLI